ncbi:hypothetical protein [Cupriavidus basilensis]|nr:hypothetical protein [Cupriavidus basilensis]
MSTVDRLANGYFSRHPVQGMVLLLLAFGVAGAVAPGVELLLPPG